MTEYLKKNAYKFIITLLICAIVFLLLCYFYIFIKEADWIFWSAISTISIIGGSISYNIMKTSTDLEVYLTGALYIVVVLVFYIISGAKYDMFVCRIILNLLFLQGCIFLVLNLFSLIKSPI